MTKPHSNECILDLIFKSHLCHRLQKHTMSVLLYKVRFYFYCSEEPWNG